MGWNVGGEDEGVKGVKVGEMQLSWEGRKSQKSPCFNHLHNTVTSHVIGTSLHSFQNSVFFFSFANLDDPI